MACWPQATAVYYIVYYVFTTTNYITPGTIYIERFMKMIFSAHSRVFFEKQEQMGLSLGPGPIHPTPRSMRPPWWFQLLAKICTAGGAVSMVRRSGPAACLKKRAKKNLPPKEICPWTTYVQSRRQKTKSTRCVNVQNVDQLFSEKKFEATTKNMTGNSIHP